MPLRSPFIHYSCQPLKVLLDSVEILLPAISPSFTAMRKWAKSSAKPWVEVDTLIIVAMVHYFPRPKRSSPKKFNSLFRL